MDHPSHAFGTVPSLRGVGPATVGTRGEGRSWAGGLAKLAACTVAVLAGAIWAAHSDWGRPTGSPSLSAAVAGSWWQTAAPQLPEGEARGEPTLAITGHDGLGERLRDGMVMTGAAKNRIILFTFDDGPMRSTTPVLLDHLDAHGIKAVFFLTASRIAGTTRQERAHIEIARDIVRRGHIAGSHTVDHLQLPILNDIEVRQQIVGAEQIFERAYGDRPWLFRPPGGGRSNRVDRLIAERGYTIVLWNLGSGDFQVRTAADVHQTWRNVFERREKENGDRGGIILMHDTHPWSVEAFELIVADLLARNCALVETGEELYDIVDDPSFFFVPRADADASAETPAAVLPPALLEERQAELREATERRCGQLAPP